MKPELLTRLTRLPRSDRIAISVPQRRGDREGLILTILFTRTLTVLGNPRETGGWAQRMAKLATDKTGQETALWVGLSGAAPGTFIFSAFYQNMAEFATAAETLMADEQYLDGVTEARQHLVGPPEDRHVEIIHTAGGEYRRPGLGGVVQLTTATPPWAS